MYIHEGVGLNGICIFMKGVKQRKMNTSNWGKGQQRPNFS